VFPQDPQCATSVFVLFGMPTFVFTHTPLQKRCPLEQTDSAHAVPSALQPDVHVVVAPGVHCPPVHVLAAVATPFTHRAA
jgi:hypothetical protein